MSITLHINGQVRSYESSPDVTLFRLLRSDGIFSVRYGSDDGTTGADAILLDGKLVNSTTLLAGQAVGHEITTVESLSEVGTMHPLQKAFIELGAIQSGYSTPAMILAAKALLDRDDSPSEEAVRDALSGVLCRETGYLRPVQAVLHAAAEMRGEATKGDSRLNIVETSSSPPTFPFQPVAEDVAGTEKVESRSDVVGHPAVKVDALKLVKGYAAFTDDVDLKGLLHADLLVSPHAHARILDIDDSAARALPGVKAVIHYKNIERVKYASGGQSYPNPPPYDQVSFDDKVRYVGDRVAAVAATTAEIAQQALSLIEVTYEVLPAVFEPNLAMFAGAPVIHDELDTEQIHDRERNIVHHIEAELGDVTAGFNASDLVLERTYDVHQVQQAPIEPHIAISWWDADERLVVRTSTQVPFHARRMIAPLLGLPVSRIRVIKPRIGGGFGVKQEVLIEDIVGHLTMATGSPVKFEMNRLQEFQSSRTRHPEQITFKSGVNRDGKLISLEMKVVANTGAYGTHGLTVLTVSGLRGLSSYNADNRRFDCDVVYTNLPVPGAYRGYGAPQALFALESHMDEIAAALDMDPIEFRALNWIRSGDPLPMATLLGEGEKETVSAVPVVRSCGLEACFEEAAAAIDWPRRAADDWRRDASRPSIRRGIGTALCMHGTSIPGLDMGAASIKINDDGSFNLVVGAADLGTGSDTVLAQIAAEVLGVTLDKIIIYSSDTDMTPFDTGAYASSTTYISGNAVKHASEKAAAQIRARAAVLFGNCRPDEIKLTHNRAVAPSGDKIPLATIALHSLHQEQQNQIMASASFVGLESPPPFASQMAEVEVDIETGELTVTDLVMAVDAGVPINPMTASGQVEGGMIQALGYAHCEEMIYDDRGRLLNGRFGPYHIYRADEMPSISAILIVTDEPTGPYGAKAIAEIPMDGVAPAIANAIFDATGVRIRELPFTPQRVLKALKSQPTD